MTLEQTRQRLGRFGVWLTPITLRNASIPLQRKEFARIETLGYGSLWSGEPPAASPGGGREAFTQHGLMLAATERIVVGTGIANLGLRDPVIMHTGAATLAEAYPGRFILGLGGQRGDRPLSQLREYLDAMDSARSRLLPDIEYPRIIAALGPKAHQLAKDRTDSVHPFMQPVAHTANARALLGPEKLLIPHQAAVLDADPVSARSQVRAIFASGPSGETPYTKNFRRLGYGDDDLADGRSDRLVDAVFAWGDEQAVATRLHAHLDAGADHVLVHPLAADLTATVDQLERLSGYLG